ncbi:MAG: hypothetical protein WB564_08110 [Dehalococcoidia bacterium]
MILQNIKANNKKVNELPENEGKTWAIRNWRKNRKLTCGNLITYGGPLGTVPELLFERKGLIPALQRLLVGYQKTAE